MTNENLLEAVKVARQRMHDAPLAEWSKDHKGHSAIVHHTSAWAYHSKEWMRLANEVDRRGLKQP